MTRGDVAPNAKQATKAGMIDFIYKYRWIMGVGVWLAFAAAPSEIDPLAQQQAPLSKTRATFSPAS
jgi:hypothetical protein